MTNLTPPPATQDAGARAACLQRLATALSGYSDLAVTVRADGPAPCLAARNTNFPDLSESVNVKQFGHRLAFVWSWGERICDASAPDAAALAIAYVLAAHDAQLGR